MRGVGATLFLVAGMVYSTPSGAAVHPTTDACWLRLLPVSIMAEREGASVAGGLRPYVADPFADYKNRGEERAGEFFAEKHGMTRGTPARIADEADWRPFVAWPGNVEPIEAAAPLGELLEAGIASLPIPEPFADALRLHPMVEKRSPMVEVCWLGAIL